ncbi:MAG TPA: biopolymer transporter ExbD [Rhizomicrobium sp.]|jgi:biopolymer transport protein ExbD|nr:biopolymer transporter ExbD [Rhizomicrobium sp.]
MFARVFVFAIATAVLAGTAGAAPVCRTHIRIHNDGSVEIDGTRYSNRTELKLRLNEYKEQLRDCQVSILAGENARFEDVGRVIAMMQELGVLKIGFLTEPKAGD